MIANYLETKKNPTQLLEKISFTNDHQELEFLLSELLDEVRDTLKGDRIVLYFNDKIVAESLLFGWKSILGTSLKPRELGRKLMVLSQQDEITTNPLLFSVNLIELWEIKSSLTVPIFINKKLFGLILVHYCADFHNLSALDIDYLEKFAQKLEVCFEKSNLLNSKDENFWQLSINFITNLIQKININWAV